jgi:hypothetical protein
VRTAVRGGPYRTPRRGRAPGGGRGRGPHHLLAAVDTHRRLCEPAQPSTIIRRAGGVSSSGNGGSDMQRRKPVIAVLLHWSCSFAGGLLHGVQAQVAAETESIRVEFMGASGGMKVFNLNEAEGGFLMMKQGELLEVDDAGEMVVPPHRMNLAGGNAQWSALTTETSGEMTSYRTEFTKTEDGTSFTLRAHVARQRVTTSETVPCSGCSGGTEGVCQNVANGVCSSRDTGPPSVCAAGSQLCTQPITITSDTLKFSIVVSGWAFSSTRHRLAYSMTLKDKSNGGNTPEVTRNPGEMEIVVPGSGWLRIPKSGMIVGGAAAVPITVDVDTRTQGSQFVMDYTFPHFGAGTSLYYDPDLSSDFASDGAPAARSSAISTALAVVGGVAAVGGLMAAGLWYRGRRRYYVRPQYKRSLKNRIQDHLTDSAATLTSDNP